MTSLPAGARLSPPGAHPSRAELYARLPLVDVDRWWIDQARAAPGGRVVELGAGAGRLTAGLAGAGARVTAVECDPSMLELLRQRVGSPVEVVAADVAALPQLEPAGLVVMATALINELPDPAARHAVLTAAARCCRPDGTVALQVLGPWWLGRRAGRSTGMLRPADGGDPIEVVVDAGVCDARSGRRYGMLTYRFPDGAILHDELDAAVLTATELQAELAVAGLEITDVFGAQPPDEPTPDTPMLHLRCRPVVRGPRR